MPTWLLSSIGVAAFVALVTLTVVVIAASRRESRIVQVTDALLTLVGQVQAAVDIAVAAAKRTEEFGHRIEIDRAHVADDLATAKVKIERVASRLADDRERADLAAKVPDHAAGAVADAAAGSGDKPAGH